MDTTPIYSAIKKYVNQHNCRFHMPGHIGGQGLTAELQSFAQLDVTEVPAIDDLHMPQGAILEARKLLAKAYKATNSLFLVNGATSGIHTLFLSLNASAYVLIPRNAHRSFYGGLVLSGAWPVYYQPQIESNLNIALSVLPGEIEEQLKYFPQAEAIFVTNPTYYGTTSEIGAIAKLTSEGDQLLYVDEAHGGHFPFHSAFPKPSLDCGADAVVNGLHKNLPVLNQGAALHGGPKAPWEKIEKGFSLITTTSPSFPILASLDLSRELMMNSGTSLLEKGLNLSKHYKIKINSIKGLKCLDKELLGFPGVKGLDPLKVLVSTEGLELNGYELAHLLRVEHNIQVELAEEKIILAMMSLFHRAEDWEKLYKALQSIASKYSSTCTRKKSVDLPPLPYVLLSPRQAYFAPKRRIKLGDCKDKIAGEMVAVYPPGIPCLLPGESISPTIFDYLQYLKRSKIPLQGVNDPELNYISIIEP